MRFVSAQFIPYLSQRIWKTNAEHSNRMAKLLEAEVSKVPGVKITQRVESNGVFAIIPKAVIPKLQKDYFFYVWNENVGEVRWMTSFDTGEDEIIDFASKLKNYLTD